MNEEKAIQAASELSSAAESAIDEKAHAATETARLPGGVVREFDGGKVLLNVVRVREMTGHEEDALLDGRTPIEKRLEFVLWRCIEALESEDGWYILSDRQELKKALADLPSGDRVFLLLLLRAVSIGDLYTFAVACPACGREGRYTVNLRDVLSEAKPMKDPLEREYEVELPGGRKAVLKVQTGADEARMAAMRQKGKDVATVAMLSRVVSIDGQPANVAALKSLTLRQRNAIRRAFEEKEGGIETSIDVTCSHCGREFEAEIDIGQKDFFFPTT